MPWRYDAGPRPAAGRALPAGENLSLQEIGNIQVVVFLEDDGAPSAARDIEGLRGRLGVYRPEPWRIRSLRGGGLTIGARVGYHGGAEHSAVADRGGRGG